MREHRACHLDEVVASETLDHVRRCIGDGRQAIGQFHPGLGLDRGGEPADHVVEQLDLLVGIHARTGLEQIAHAPQGIDAAIDRTAADRVFQFGDQGLLG